MWHASKIFCSIWHFSWEFKPTERHVTATLVPYPPPQPPPIISTSFRLYLLFFFKFNLHLFLSPCLCHAVPVSGTSRGHAWPETPCRCRHLQPRPPKLDLPLARLFNACKCMNEAHIRFEAWTVTGGTMLRQRKSARTHPYCWALRMCHPVGLSCGLLLKKWNKIIFLNLPKRVLNRINEQKCYYICTAQNYSFGCVQAGSNLASRITG